MNKALTLLMIVSFTVANATIRRANNNAGVTLVPNLVYANLTTAISEAAIGDTIYIEPSLTFYSFPTTLSKRLTFIGNGYQIGDNLSLVNPLPYQTSDSLIGNGGINISLNSGSENSFFIGLSFYTNSFNVNNISSITFKRCIFKSSITISGPNNLFDQCFISGITASLGGDSKAQNNIFKNSIIQTLYGQNAAIFDNCYIGSINNFSPVIENCVFTNSIINIFSGTPSFTNTFTNCLKIGTTFPVSGINNNIENVVLSTVFIVSNPSTGTILDKNYRLSVGSPAIGTGIGGVNMGPFGGVNTYRLSGQSPIPIVTNFYMSTTGSTSSGLTGSITIQSNN